MRRITIPPELGHSFTVEQARAAGIPDATLDRMPLHRPTRAVRSLSPPPDIRTRLGELRLVLPEGSAFSHETAARVWDLPLPRPWGPDEPVHVMTPSTIRQPRRRGVVSHAGLDLRRTAEREDVGLVTSPADTWADLAATLSVDELVVLGDALFYHRRHLSTTGAVMAALARLRRGRARAAEAVALMRPDAASAMETRARLSFVRAGLPEPELNVAIVDEEGEFIGFGDLVWRDRRVVVEYDGDQHRTDRAQWQRDARRLRRMRAAGWNVIVLTADDILRTPLETVWLVRKALGL